ncbi:MAG: universal stress protein [archaeon]
MIERVLVGMDDSEMADKALEYAFEAFPDADITVVHVVGGPSPWMGEAMSIALEGDLEETKRRHAKQVLDRARAIAADHDREVETDIGMGNPAKAIVKRAEDYDQVVVGAHSGSLVNDLFVGNVAERVVRNSPAPVTVVR